jgi:hypothetical protein
MATFTPSLSQWYRFTNNYTGPTLSLDVVNDAGQNSSGTLQMADTGDFSGQYWCFVLNPSSSTSTYALYTMFLGPNMRLDVYGNEDTTPHLAAAGDYSGQIWTITSWGDGTWMLTNQYSGSGLHLDVYSDTDVPFLGDGDSTGQHWTIAPILDSDPPLPSPSSSATPSSLPSPSNSAIPSLLPSPYNSATPSLLPSPSNSATSSLLLSPSNSAAPSRSPDPTNSVILSSLPSPSNSATPSALPVAGHHVNKIELIIGGTLGGLVVILLAVLWYMRRRHSSKDFSL